MGGGIQRPVSVCTQLSPSGGLLVTHPSLCEGARAVQQQLVAGVPERPEAHHGRVLVVGAGDLLLGHLHRGQEPGLALAIAVCAGRDVDFLGRWICCVPPQDVKNSVWLDVLGGVEDGVIAGRPHGKKNDSYRVCVSEVYG